MGVETVESGQTAQPMCSIAGIIGGTGVQRMLDAQRHRAPDESGIFRAEGIELGMGRLAVVDLVSPGLAPYQEDHLVLCYNGEIYNYVELRGELQGRGWQFRTASDTEVLVKAWREWGAGMFARLNGMFAFALYDTAARRLVLARDLAGEKPLYYAHRGAFLVFASEAKAIARVIDTTRREDRFAGAFQHCYVTTLWEGVEEVPPASYLLYDLRTSRGTLTTYWELQPRRIDPQTAEEELEALLEDAVRLQIRSDVPYGLYASGGLDSSLLSSLHAFEHQFYVDQADPGLEAQFVDTIDRVLWHLDFPVGSFGLFGIWKLAEAASRKVKVVLSGEGADELFGGYIRYLPIAREYELRQHLPSYAYLFGRHFRDDYLTAFARLTCRNGDLDYVRERLRPFFSRFDDPITAMGFADFKLILPSLLQMEDRMAAAFGLENRCPFLDRRIIEFAFSLPPTMKISQLQQKVLLRRVAERRGVTEPLRKEKMGLAIPYNRWRHQPGWDRTHYVQFLKDRWSALDLRESAPAVRRMSGPPASAHHTVASGA